MPGQNQLAHFYLILPPSHGLSSYLSSSSCPSSSLSELQDPTEIKLLTEVMMLHQFEENFKVFFDNIRLLQWEFTTTTTTTTRRRQAKTTTHWCHCGQNSQPTAVGHAQMIYMHIYLTNVIVIVTCNRKEKVAQCQAIRPDHVQYVPKHIHTAYPPQTCTWFYG